MPLSQGFLSLAWFATQVCEWVFSRHSKSIQHSLDTISRFAWCCCGVAWPTLCAHGSPETEQQQQQKSTKQTQQERKPRAKLIIIVVVILLGLPYSSIVVVVVVILLASRGFCFWFCFFRSVCFVVSLLLLPQQRLRLQVLITHTHRHTRLQLMTSACVCVCVYLHLTRICIGSRNCRRLDVDKQRKKGSIAYRYRYQYRCSCRYSCIQLNAQWKQNATIWHLNDCSTYTDTQAHTCNTCCTVGEISCMLIRNMYRLYNAIALTVVARLAGTVQMKEI